MPPSYGKKKSRALDRNYVWWPGIDADIEEKVNRSDTCQSSRTSPARVPLHSWELPCEPWHRIHEDYADINGRNLLIVTDAHSKCIEVYLTVVTNPTTTREKLRCVDMRRLLNLLVRHNGPCFTSLEFAEFTRKNGIKHKLVCPYHQASNSLAESLVKIVKSGLRRISGGTLETKLSRFLLSYKTTPHTTTGVTQNCWWKGNYRQISTGWGHPLLPLYSSAKIIRNSIMTEPPICRCFTKARRFLPRTSTVAPDG